VSNKDELHQLQSQYKAAVDAWIDAIRLGEAFASSTQTVAEIDSWEEAVDGEEKARAVVSAAKKAYEEALRQELFHF